MEINVPTWESFKGQPNYTSGWAAYTYWYVGYKYSCTDTDRGTEFNIKSFYKLEEKSWVMPNQKGNVLLLRHEQFHYLIAVLCGTDFESQASKCKMNWNIDNVSEEANELFDNVYNAYIELEKLYDFDTHHGTLVDRQRLWERMILEKLSNLGITVKF
jgi:hypothetical protein